MDPKSELDRSRLQCMEIEKDAVSFGHNSHFCKRGEKAPLLLGLSALVILYFYPLKRIFYLSHRDSVIYINFLRTRHTIYLILYPN